METWLPVPGFPLYAVSNKGRVRSHVRTATGKPLKPWRDTVGHLQVKLYFPTIRTAFVHRLVMEAFVGPVPEGQIVRHLNDDKSNNSLANLAYGTPPDNCLDTVRNGGHLGANQTHCIHGHPFDAANTYMRPDRPGHRICRTCRDARNLNKRLERV